MVVHCTWTKCSEKSLYTHNGTIIIHSFYSRVVGVNEKVAALTCWSICLAFAIDCPPRFERRILFRHFALQVTLSTKCMRPTTWIVSKQSKSHKLFYQYNSVNIIVSKFDGSRSLRMKRKPENSSIPIKCWTVVSKIRFIAELCTE